MAKTKLIPKKRSEMKIVSTKLKPVKVKTQNALDTSWIKEIYNYSKFKND